MEVEGERARGMEVDGERGEGMGKVMATDG